MAAAEWLWRRYGPGLIRLARAQLGDTPRSMSDEEDVVQNVFSDFYTGVAEGRFAHVTGRSDLWGLLAKITSRKAANERKYHTRKKRHPAVQDRRGDSKTVEASAAVADTGPSPELQAEMQETLVHMIECLEDPVLKQIATWVLEGHSQDEIARRLNCVPRTVRRKVQLIRGKWLAESYQ